MKLTKEDVKKYGTREEVEFLKEEFSDAKTPEELGLEPVLFGNPKYEMGVYFYDPQENVGRKVNANWRGTMYSLYIKVVEGGPRFPIDEKHHLLKYAGLLWQYDRLVPAWKVEEEHR